MAGKLGRNAFTVTPKTVARAAIMQAALDPLGIAPPMSPGYSAIVEEMRKGDWGMDGNDNEGDCTAADPAHRLMLWSANTTGIVVPTTAETLKLYHDIVGPGDPGSDLPTVAQYLDETGFTVGGKVFKEDGYGVIDPGNVNHWKWAICLFGCAPIGINIQQAQMDQFDAGEPWDFVPDSPFIGGHDVVVVEYTPDGNVQLVTWGKRITATRAFMNPANGILDEIVPVVSHEFLRGGARHGRRPNGKRRRRHHHGITPSGINLTQMIADLKAVG